MYECHIIDAAKAKPPDSMYRVSQKNKPGYYCNNFVHCQPTFSRDKDFTR